MSTKIQLKRGLDANINAASLAAGEPAFVTDTGKLYIGDGTNKTLINPINKIAGLNTTNSYSKYKVNEYGQVVQQLPLASSDIPLLPYTQITGLGSAATANLGILSGTVPVIDATNKLPITVIPPITSSLITDLGTAATLNVGTNAGNIPLLDATGKLAISTIPSIAITDIFTVSSQIEMLALPAEVGDIAIRTDLNATLILKTLPATNISNWVQLATPTDSVTSVNGSVGVVVLGALDINMTNYIKAAIYSPISATDSTSAAIGKLEKNYDNYAPITSPILLGTPQSTTPIATDNSTKIATTAFVQNALLIVDGGTF